jgi:phosphatidylserine decarboxylase
VGLLLWTLILYFFRDPQRIPGQEPGVLLSAADGEVVEIAREQETAYLGRDMIRISVFLSIFDVHVQRAPIDGTVSFVHHQPGRFLQAFRPEASTANEHIATLFQTEYGPVLVKQIAGILARRCVNYLRPGQSVRAGQRFGLIRFGSRVDLFVAPGAEILVNVGDRVAGAVTPIAHLSETA